MTNTTNKPGRPWRENVRRDRGGNVYSRSWELRAGIWRVSVHNLLGCDGWFLSIHPDAVVRLDLETADEDAAKAKAEAIVRDLFTDALHAVTGDEHA